MSIAELLICVAALAAVARRPPGGMRFRQSPVFGFDWSGSPAYWPVMLRRSGAMSLYLD
jgi:hypothetical protein